MSTDKEYVKPETEDTSAAVEAPVVPAPTKQAPVQTLASVIKTPVPAVEVKAAEPTLAPIPDVIGVGKMLNAKGNLVTADMIARINRHMKYLTGEEGFNNVEERNAEQISFIETIGNSMKQDFEGYVVVTDYLLEQIRANQQVFTDGLAFRFTVGLDKGPYYDIVKSYQSYMQVLTKIAINWNVRFKLKKLIDITYAANSLQPQAKRNLTQYFNKLASV
jgi:hypothetical protein